MLSFPALSSLFSVIQTDSMFARITTYGRIAKSRMFYLLHTNFAGSQAAVDFVAGGPTAFRFSRVPQNQKLHVRSLLVQQLNTKNDVSVISVVLMPVLNNW